MYVDSEIKATDYIFIRHEKSFVPTWFVCLSIIAICTKISIITELAGSFGPHWIDYLQVIFLISLFLDALQCKMHHVCSKNSQTESGLKTLAGHRTRSNTMSTLVFILCSLHVFLWWWSEGSQLRKNLEMLACLFTKRKRRKQYSERTTACWGSCTEYSVKIKASSAVYAALTPTCVGLNGQCVLKIHVLL